MATVSAPNRTIIAWLFIVAGVLQVIAVGVSLGNVGDVSAIYAISNLALGVGFALMAAWLAAGTVAIIAYIIAAIGWLLLALTSIINLGFIGSFALFVAVIGSIFAGVVVFTGKPFSPSANVVFLAAMIMGALNLLMSQNGNVPYLFKDIIIIAFGVLLVVFGFFALRKR